MNAKVVMERGSIGDHDEYAAVLVWFGDSVNDFFVLRMSAGAYHRLERQGEDVVKLLQQLVDETNGREVV